MIEFWQVLILIAIVSGAILFGVGLGAYCVFRTKREGHEQFFGDVPKGEVFSIDGLNEEEDEPAEIPETVKKRTDDFMNQFMGGEM